MSLILLEVDPIIETPIGAVISANWVMLILAAVVSFFLIKTLAGFQKALDGVVKTVNEIQVKLAVHDEKFKLMDENYVKGAAGKMAEHILAKLNIIKGE